MIEIISAIRHVIPDAVWGAFSSGVIGIVILILTNQHNKKVLDTQIQAIKIQAQEHYDFEIKRINDDRNYQNKAKLISAILSIIDENDLTAHAIDEDENEVYKIDELIIDRKYKDTQKVANQIIKKLYLSFPELIEYGNEIKGQCNLIWGYERNYFGYQADKPEIQLKTKEQLVQFYNELNKICNECLNKLKEM